MANKRKYTLYFDLSQRVVFDLHESEIPATLLPYITTQEKMQLEIHICNSKSVTDVYTGFAGQEITAEASVDDNWNWYLPGKVSGAYSGAITEIRVNYTGGGYVSPIGKMYIKSAAGLSEEISYTAYTKTVEGLYTFEIAANLVGSYTTNDHVDIVDTPLIKSAGVDIDMSNQATGKFVITLSASNLKYIASIEGKPEIKNAMFEFKVFNVEMNLVCCIQFDFKCLNIRDFGGSFPPPTASESIFKNYVIKKPWELLNFDESQVINSFDLNKATIDDVYAVLGAIIKQLNTTN